jgi:hypothetical protein
VSVGGDDRDVVWGGISPGTGDGETLLGGAGHEKKLGPLALLFEVSEDGAFSCHGVPRLRRIKKAARKGRFLIHCFYFQNINSKRKLCQGLELYIWRVFLRIDAFE